MAQSAQVTSVEAIESFRANLVVYLGKVRPVFEEINSQVQRLRFWLDNEQRRKWEQELRIRNRRLEEAKNELVGARLSNMREATSLQVMAVQRTERAVREAEEKLTVIKRWDRELENQTDPLVRQLEQVQGFLATDMAKAVVYLSQVVKTLDAYTGVLPPSRATGDASTPEKKDSGT
jgi:hypothetical protein